MNDLAAGVFGDGDANTAGTQLVLAKPELEFVQENGKKELSFAGNFNGDNFGLNLDGQNIGVSFELPKIDVNTLKNALATITGIAADQLPTLVTQFLGILESTAKLKVDSNQDEFAIAYLDNVNIKDIAPLVAPNGTLLLIARQRDFDAEPDDPPWPLSEKELAQFQELGLSEISRDTFFEAEQNHVKQVRIEYQLRVDT